MKTFRRDKLRRLVEAGKIVAVGSYHFDDMTGGDHSRHANTPVALRPDDWKDRKEGVFYVLDCDFTTGSGCCYLSDDDTICHLRVHSNCNYDFRMADGSKFTATSKAPKAQRPENQKLQAYLAHHGIDCTPKLIREGSMRGVWRLSNPALRWSLELASQLNALGFTSWDGRPLGEFDGNGGTFCAFVRGHSEFLT